MEESNTKIRLRQATTAKAIAQAKRTAAAVALRKEGFSLQEIAEKLNCHINIVYRCVVQTIQKIAKQAEKPAEEYLTEELAKADVLWEAYIGKAITGDIDAANILIKVARHKAKLLGLGSMNELPAAPAAPVQVNVGVQVDQSETKIELNPREAIAQALHERDYLEYLRQRAMAATDDAGPVCANGKPGIMANGKALGLPGPGHNGHSNGNGRLPPPLGDNATPPRQE